MAGNSEEKPVCKCGPFPREHQSRRVLFLLLPALLVGIATAGLLWETMSRNNPVDTPAERPNNAAALAAFLNKKLPQARIVSTRADGQIDRSFYLTIGHSDADTLRSLPRAAERSGQWRGTVLCEWLVNREPEDVVPEECGPYALALPPFVFFGDKELLEKIKDLLR